MSLGPLSLISPPRWREMIEVILNDRLGKKIRVKCKCAPRLSPYAIFPPFAPALTRMIPCSEDDTVGDLKKLVAAQTGA